MLLYDFYQSIFSQYGSLKIQFLQLVILPYLHQFIKGGTAAALSKLPTPATPETSSGSYSVNSDGTVTMNLTVGTQTVTGTGAVSATGEVIAVAVHIQESGIDAGRGLLFLVRQP